MVHNFRNTHFQLFLDVTTIFNSIILHRKTNYILRHLLIRLFVIGNEFEPMKIKQVAGHLCFHRAKL